MSWSGVGDAYAASYADLCAGTGVHLRDALGAGAGRSLLDVGGGDGTLAAQWQTDGWRTTICEPEASMRAVAERRRPRIDVVAGALPELPYDDAAFDAVVANFVLNHVDDPRVAAAELRRVASGAVAATIWAVSPSWLWGSVIERAGLEAAAPARLPEHLDFARSAEGFGGMLRDAGWRADVSEVTWTWRTDAEALWTSVEGGVAASGAYYLGLDDGRRKQFRRAFDDVVSDLAVGGAIELEHTAVIAVDKSV